MSTVSVYARGHQKPAASKSTVILPQNMVGKSNVLVQEMMSQDNARYIIRWDFDLEGRTITVPAGSILSFEGGSLCNGTVRINGADIWPDYDALADSQNLTIEGYPKTGVMRWDYENQKPVWSTGEKWVNALGGDAEETNTETE